jgi:cytochrome o ubiquinol oxidase subunit 2
MVTRLHLQADQPGSYRGMSAQFSGDGFSDMYFNVEAVAPEKFSEWVEATRNVGVGLNVTTYAELAKPSAAVAPFTYSSVAPRLFDSIQMSEMQSDDAMCRSYPTSMRTEK